jgi:uncharacterized protein YjdB
VSSILDPLPQPDTIVVAPATTTLNAEGAVRLVATAHWPDSSTTDVSAECHWTSSDDAVVAVNSSRNTPGLVLGVNAGTATVTATYPLYEFYVAIGPVA